MIDTVEVRNAVLVANPAPEYRYQLQAEVGSSMIEVSQTGEVLSVEEYDALGGSVYRAYLDSARLQDKQYRFSAQHRDEETGLYLLGSRHYAPWLGRWISCDPWWVRWRGQTHTLM